MREGGREGRRVEEKHQCARDTSICCLSHPTGDLGHNPVKCSDQELNQLHFGLQASTQSTEPYQPGPPLFFLNVA